MILREESVSCMCWRWWIVLHCYIPFCSYQCSAGSGLILEWRQSHFWDLEEVSGCETDLSHIAVLLRSALVNRYWHLDEQPVRLPFEMLLL